MFFLKKALLHKKKLNKYLKNYIKNTNGKNLVVIFKN